MDFSQREAVNFSPGKFVTSTPEPGLHRKMMYRKLQGYKDSELSRLTDEDQPLHYSDTEPVDSLLQSHFRLTKDTLAQSQYEPELVNSTMGTTGISRLKAKPTVTESSSTNSSTLVDKEDHHSPLESAMPTKNVVYDVDPEDILRTPNRRSSTSTLNNYIKSHVSTPESSSYNRIPATPATPLPPGAYPPTVRKPFSKLFRTSPPLRSPQNRGNSPSGAVLKTNDAFTRSVHSEESLRTSPSSPRVRSNSSPHMNSRVRFAMEDEFESSLTNSSHDEISETSETELPSRSLIFAKTLNEFLVDAPPPRSSSPELPPLTPPYIPSPQKRPSRGNTPTQRVVSTSYNSPSSVPVVDDLPRSSSPELPPLIPPYIPSPQKKPPRENTSKPRANSYSSSARDLVVDKQSRQNTMSYQAELSSNTFSSSQSTIKGKGHEFDESSSLNTNKDAVDPNSGDPIQKIATDLRQEIKNINKPQREQISEILDRNRKTSLSKRRDLELEMRKMEDRGESEQMERVDLVKKIKEAERREHETQQQLQLIWSKLERSRISHSWISWTLLQMLLFFVLWRILLPHSHPQFGSINNDPFYSLSFTPKHALPQLLDETLVIFSANDTGHWNISSIAKITWGDVISVSTRWMKGIISGWAERVVEWGGQ